MDTSSLACFYKKKQQEATRSNKKATRNILKQQQFLKINNLKPNPPRKSTTTNDRHIKQPRRLCASSVKDNVIPPRKQSRTNLHQPNIIIK